MMLDAIEIRRVRLRLRAGISGFDAEPDLTSTDPLAMPVSAIKKLKADPLNLLALQVRDDGLAPMIFEDDWIVIDTSDVTKRSGELYAVNWNGEACVLQIAERGGQWYLSYLNPAFKPINVRSGQLNIVGRVVYQPGRIVTSRL